MNRESERKRLVELTRKHLKEELGMNIHTDILEKYADHLLDNGIVVPPVKVGQTLYLVRQDIQKIIEVVVTAIMQRKTFQYAEVDIVEDNRKSFITLAYWGNRLFPTREEAKKALEGSGEK